MEKLSVDFDADSLPTLRSRLYSERKQYVKVVSEIEGMISRLSSDVKVLTERGGNDAVKVLREKIRQCRKDLEKTHVRFGFPESRNLIEAVYSEYGTVGKDLIDWIPCVSVSSDSVFGFVVEVNVELCVPELDSLQVMLFRDAIFFECVPVSEGWFSLRGYRKRSGKPDHDQEVFPGEIMTRLQLFLGNERQRSILGDFLDEALDPLVPIKSFIAASA